MEMKRNEGQRQQPQQRQWQRQMIIGSFALLMIVSTILIAWMIRDLAGAPVECSSSTWSASLGSGIEEIGEKSAVSKEKKLSVPLSEDVLETSQGVGKAGKEEAVGKESEKAVGEEAEGEAEGGESEGEAGETGGNDGMYLPLQIDEIRSSREITTTAAFFKERIPYLQQAMKESGFYFSEKLLDPESGTKAYILARNENCAQNLNAYFYYLFDETESAHIVFPFVLNLSQLFDESDRKSVVDSGSFAEPEHAQALRMSLAASLGKHYDGKVYDFIMKEYKRLFQDRIAGKPLQAPAFKLKLPELEVIFHHSFLTYVEFFIQS